MSLHARVWKPQGAADRPAVVLVHGLGMSSRYMVPLAECLAHHLSIYAPDLPGSGLSDKPARPLSVRELADALAAWMEAAGLPRATFVGNSLGCEILVDLAVHHPERVLSMVLQGPTADPRYLSPVQHIGRFLVTALFERWSLGWVAVSDYLRFGVRRFHRTFGEMIANRIEGKLPLVPAPTLVVWGTRDYIVPRRSVERVADLIPKAKLAVIPGAAHGMNYSHPWPLARCVLAFLEIESDL
jgi:2-hydroxy-6-oxonona-2,4-dienedioate hydrolase